MDFEYSDEQRMLRESVDRFVSERYAFESRLNMAREPEGWSRAAWKEMAELGLLALPFSEADGGFGGGGVELMIVMEALGRGLVLEPYLSTVILAGQALSLAGSTEQKSSRLPPLMHGDHLISLAHHEPEGLRHGLAASTRASRSDGFWKLSGRKTAVLHGATAQEFIVSATSTAGLSLFLVPGDAAGVKVLAKKGYDSVPVADLLIDEAILDPEALLGQEGRGGETLQRVFDFGVAAMTAEAVGIMAETLELTTEYLKTRQQFGVAIGTFQVLQHRAVDMLMQLELSRSMAILAALSLAQPSDARARNIAAAKVQIGRSGRFIGQQAVQLHGAIGITSEYKVGHCFKRLTAIDALLGDADYHLDRLAEGAGTLGAAE